VTSSTYRMASTSEENCARIDPDNVHLWRMPSRRLEAEAIRDNMLYIAGDLDLTMGGPDIDHALGLTSKRRSLYLRIAAEKEVEFLRIFDGPTVTECYERRPSVMPQQALALANSDLAFRQAASVAGQIGKEASSEDDFIRRVYQRVLARTPKAAEMTLCRDFLGGNDPLISDKSKIADDKRRENLVLVLLNHNDFVTIR